MVEPGLIVNVGLFVVTALATTIAWAQAIAAGRAERGALDARRRAEDAVAAAERQADAAEFALAQSDRYRVEDRRSAAIIELAQMLIDDADVVMRSIDQRRAQLEGTVGRTTLTALDRFRNNAHFVRAQALLVDDEVAVSNWALAQSGSLYDTAAALVEEHGLPDREVGPARAAAMKIATDAIAKLFAWQRDQLALSWFVEQGTKKP